MHVLFAHSLLLDRGKERQKQIMEDNDRKHRAARREGGDADVRAEVDALQKEEEQVTSSQSHGIPTKERKGRDRLRKIAKAG